MQSSVRSFGGEFKAQASEAVYRTEHLTEARRQARLCFLAAALVNPLFLFTDVRFYGQPHFYYAISARGVLVFVSLACLAAVEKVHNPRQCELVCIVWACLVIPGSAVLVSPHTDIALLVTFILPAIFYLVVPFSFRMVLLSGVGCSTATMAAYMSSAPLTRTSFGLAAGMVLSNAVLTLVLSQWNRLRRLEWAATRAERAAKEKLVQSRDMLENLLKAVPAPLIVTAKDSGSVIHVNDAARDYFGTDFSEASWKIENHIDRHDWNKLAAALESDGQTSGFETRVRLFDGSEKDVLLSATTASMAGTEAILTVFVDITSRKELEAIMKRLANTDPLTGIPNRARFFTAAADEIKRTKRYGGTLSVFMIDIDFFKRINDTHGHEFGDRALKAFAKLCRKWIRQQDTVARLGGEEFGLLLPETNGASALVLADRLRAEVEQLQVDSLAKPITISIGVSEVHPGEQTVDAALFRADQALYSAKRAGRNMAMLYNDAGPLSPGIPYEN